MINKNVFLVLLMSNVSITTTVHANRIGICMGDALLTAIAASRGYEQMPLAEKVKFASESPSVSAQINRDIERIKPLTPILIPVGLGLSVLGRINLLAKSSPIGFLFNLTYAALSIVINPTLCAAGYGIRLAAVEHNAGPLQQTGDGFYVLVKTGTDAVKNSIKDIDQKFRNPKDK